MSSICHCSDRPKLSIDRLQNGSLKIDIWNLPKFAYLIKVWIRRGYEELYAMNLVSSLFVLLKNSYCSNIYPFMPNGFCYLNSLAIGPFSNRRGVKLILLLPCL